MKECCEGKGVGSGSSRRETGVGGKGSRTVEENKVVWLREKESKGGRHDENGIGLHF